MVLETLESSCEGSKRKHENGAACTENEFTNGDINAASSGVSSVSLNHGFSHFYGFWGFSALGDSISHCYVLCRKELGFLEK